MDSVRFEQGNLRKALAHATAAADAGLSLPLGSALGWYAYTRGRLGDGVATLDRALAVADPVSHAPGDSLIRALLIAAVLALGRGDLDDVDALLTRVLAVDDDQRRTAIATAFLGLAGPAATTTRPSATTPAQPTCSPSSATRPVSPGRATTSRCWPAAGRRGRRGGPPAGEPDAVPGDG